nr:immunoglobulin light chain junction region [Macaca mulatta]MOV77000.1 immunoglobulin light chain junction region [Macaca mulatta]
CFQYRSGWTF